MSDPNWNKGHYYDGPYPKMGMKLARFVTSAVLYGTLWLLCKLLSYINCKRSARFLSSQIIQLDKRRPADIKIHLHINRN